MTFSEYGESRNVKASTAYNYAMYLHRDLFEGHFTKEGRTISIDDEAVAMLDKHFSIKKEDLKGKKVERKNKETKEPTSKVITAKTENEIKMVKRGKQKKSYQEQVQLEKSMLLAKPIEKDIPAKPNDETSAIKDEIARLRAENEKLRNDNLKLGKEAETNEDRLLKAASQLELNNLALDHLHTHLKENGHRFDDLTKIAHLSEMELKIAHAIYNKDKESIHELAVILCILFDHMLRVEEELGLDDEEDDYDPCDDCGNEDCNNCGHMGWGDD